MIQVRRVQPKDLKYIFNNAEDLAFEQELMSNKLENMFLVIDNNEICGIGFYFNIENKCILNWINIKENYRRNGLGSMLVKTMLNIAEQQGALQAYLQGKCEDFAEFLGFQKIIGAKEIDEINNTYNDLFQTHTFNNIYKVNLFGYFKPCSNNTKCK